MAQDSTQQRPVRRFYSAELKAQVIQACQQAGVSVAGALRVSSDGLYSG